MAKRVKYTGEGSVIRCGHTLDSGVYYTIEPFELVKWQNDDTVVTELTSGVLVINDGTTDIAGASKAIDFLRDVPGPVAVASTPAFAAKTVMVNGVLKSLYARNTGFQQALASGANVVEHTIGYPWVKLIGAEVVGSEVLDTISFKVYDTAAGTYSGVPNKLLNQFGFTVNLPAGYYRREAPYDADLYAGMVLKLEYNSVSAKTVGFNLVMNEVK